MATIDTTANYSTLYQRNIDHNVSFSSDISVNMQLENNFTVSRNLKDAVVLMNSRLLSYFESPQTPRFVQTIFLNYISAIYPSFLNYPGSVTVDLIAELSLTGCVILIAILMMSYWVYIGLLIDKKRYDIMIWFLDIPVPYVAHLGNHCDKFLKEFVTVKELTQRGLKLEDDDDNF
jgi:hypothetical protein